MRREEPAVRKWVECDGCGYVIGVTREASLDGAEPEDNMTVLTVPWDTDPADRAEWVTLEFHFHAPSGYRRDCFRYWAKSTHTMRASLKERGLEDEEIDEFLATHLYREKVGA